MGFEEGRTVIFIDLIEVERTHIFWNYRFLRAIYDNYILPALVFLIVKGNCVKEISHDPQFLMFIRERGFLHIMVTDKKISQVENQINKEQRNVSYDIRELTIEYYVDKYLKDEDVDNNELYIPDYQREFIWDDNRQSRFIESIILGLPVPLIFVAEIESSGRLEVVDGSQRIRTLAAFLNDDLTLKNLKKLSELNGLTFGDFKASRKRLFNNTSMRMIVLSSKATEDVRNDMFDRINTSSVPLLPMETRRGIYRGPFIDFLGECANNEKFTRLCPISRHFDGRREGEELILRFFAFSEAFPQFKIYGADLRRTGVARFLDRYLAEKNKKTSSLEQELIQKKKDFFKMLNFVDQTFPGRGFAKYEHSHETSRLYFEAISIGSHFALQKKPDLRVKNTDWAYLDKNNPNEFYKTLSGRYHTHKPNRIRGRINYVTQMLLSG